MGELKGGFGDGQSFMEVSRVKPGSAAEKGGIVIGDRLVTVNEVFVVFLPVRDVMIAFDIVDTVARVEFERPTRRSEFASREAVRREIRRENVGVEMKQLLSTENSIYSPRNWSWNVLEQHRLADKAEVAGRTRRFDCKLESSSSSKQEVFLAKPHDGKKDFELNRKINNFVSKYYKA